MHSLKHVVGVMILIGAGQPAFADGTITGNASDGAGGRAILCTDSGIPLRRETAQAFTADMDAIEEAAHDFWSAPIAPDGSFDLGLVPDGDYRVVALRWALAPGESVDTNDQSDYPESVFNVQGQDVTLLGSTQITIHNADATVTLRSPGKAILHIDCGAPNDETLLIASPRPTAADPILGFAGWAGPFIQHWVAGNRMPDGKTTLRGLPAGEIHIAIFSWDNNPGWGAGSVTLKENEEVWVEQPFVTTWSDAVHSPPKRLEPLVEKLVANGELTSQDTSQIFADVLGNQAEELMSTRNPMAAMAKLGSLRGKLVQSGPHKGTHALDVLAALGYAQIQSMMKKQGREPNPHRGLKVLRRRDTGS